MIDDSSDAIRVNFAGLYTRIQLAGATNQRFEPLIESLNRESRFVTASEFQEMGHSYIWHSQFQTAGSHLFLYQEKLLVEHL